MIEQARVFPPKSMLRKCVPCPPPSHIRTEDEDAGPLMTSNPPPPPPTLTPTPFVHQYLQRCTGNCTGVLATASRRKLAWFGHVTRRNSLSKTILQGTLEDGRRRGPQRRCWMDNIQEWTYVPMPELLTRGSCRKGCKRISAESSIMPPSAPPPDDQIGQGTELN